VRDHPQTMAMQQLQGSGRDVPTEVNLRRAAKIITSDLLRRLRNTDLVDDPARLEAADRIEALENALRGIQRASMKVNPPRHSWYYDCAEAALAPEDK
jgi:hypothetical protein